jgi:hypothetical protein
MALFDHRWRKQIRAVARFVTWRRTPPWPGFGQAFNGQDVRLRTIRSLVDRFDPDAFLETGTFLGHTTRFFSGNNVPVYTVEVKPSIYAAAKVRLSIDPNDRIILKDSGSAVSDLARQKPFERPFAYLDAHWWEALPLPGEVRDLLTTWDDVLIAIDDFYVPGDEGYGYDEFEGKPLSLEMLDISGGAIAAFPAAPASEETGGKRGTVYIGRGDGRKAIEQLIEAGMLKAAEVPAAA